MPCFPGAPALLNFPVHLVTKNLRMKKISLLFFFHCFLVMARAQKLMGFTDAHAVAQANWEKQFDSQLNAQSLDTWMKFLSSHPHHVGSPQDKANAEYMAALFRQWGYQTEISTYYVLFPTPKTRVLELLGSKPYKAKLEEPTIPEDHTSG